MADPRLLSVDLDDRTILARSPEIEQERQTAIEDLLAGNLFRPRRAFDAGYQGPYRLSLRVEEGRLAMDVAGEDGTLIETIMLAMGGFRRSIKDYFAICDSYYKALASASPQQIEPIDMARRGIHNGAAELLTERLEGKVEVDFDTARRLFTLICVLHIRS